MSTPTTRPVELLCGARVLRVDAALCEQSTPRVFWRAFLGHGVPALTVTQTAHGGGTRLDGPLGTCAFTREGARLQVQVDARTGSAELALRLAWYLCAVEQGAVLLHACALRHGERALVACGQSGDGKSTLSRLGADAGLTLLSDEVVLLFPDGRVSGTPFRSDLQRPGAPGVVQARYFLALEKAQDESLTPLTPLDAVQLALGQCFELPEVALPRAEVRRRLLAFLGEVTPRTLRFRRDAAAGHFVKRALE